MSEKEKLNKLFFSSLSLIFYPAIIFTVIIFIISDNVSFFLFENYDYSVQIKIVSAAVPFIVLNTIMEGYLRGLKIINIYTRVVIISNIVNVVIIVPLVLMFGLNGGLIGILSANVSYILISYYYLNKMELIGLKEFRFYFDSELFKKIIKVSFVFLISGALFQFSLILLRKIIIAEYGIYYNGIYQSVIGISLNYFGFIFLSLSTYSFPTISKLETKEELRDELNINFKYIIHIIVPLIIIIFTFRRIVLTILFSKEFLPAENFFGFQFFGDYFKSLAWALGIWLVPKLKLKIFLLLELILNLNLIVISYLMINVLKLEIEFISLAYLITYFIHFILNFYFTRLLLGFELQKSIKRIFYLSFFILVPVFLISSNFVITGYIIILPVLMIWAKLSLEKNEIDEIKYFILIQLNRFKK